MIFFSILLCSVAKVAVVFALNLLVDFDVFSGSIAHLEYDRVVPLFCLVAGNCAALCVFYLDLRKASMLSRVSTRAS